MFTLKAVVSGEEHLSDVRPVWVSGVWECQSFRVTDPEGAGYVVVEPEPEKAPAIITVLAFRKRFTTSEKAAMEIAALDDPTAELEARQTSAVLRATMKDSDSATYIDLADEDTRAGVKYMEAAGLLAEGRALEILDGEVQEKERL